ncbi:MAG: ribose-5-phosphate isomerase RpiA [Candidatus Thermoplasmatota archaeon]|nr:ribose-5-phosphate isomerase RpiA [Candidatus Thermoplasmatota archaeon]
MTKRIEIEKKAAALRAADLIEDHMIIGLGTGSTVHYFIEELETRIKNGLQISCIPTSEESRKLAEKAGMKVLKSVKEELDLDVDGADEVDSKGNLIKGGGGALTREKIVAASSRKVCIIIDSSKYHPEGLGKFRIPVEVLPFMLESTIKRIEQLGGKVYPRENGDYRTDNGNSVLDCDFGIIQDPGKTETKLKMIPGVFEVGIFHSLADIVIMGTGNSTKTIFQK